jgi:GNAT superfamily N-acetyltransferase
MNINELKELWRISFDVSEQYTDFYFSRRYRPENTRACSADGKIVSAAQFFPYNISCGKSLLKGVYILGVCTHPSYRHRGFAARIIKSILKEQAANGAELAFLIPSTRDLFGVYEKFGFGELFMVYEGSVESVASPGGYEIINPAPDELFGFYSRIYAALPSAVLKTKDDFSFAFQDMIMSGGRIDVCGVDGEIRGFAATEGCIVKELLCLDEAARDTLLSRLLADIGGGLTVLSPDPQPGAVKKPLGMARVLRPGAFLAKTVKEQRPPIYLTDGLYPQNNGIYSIHNGRVEFSPGQKPDAAVDISTLPAYAMEASYANLLLN